MKRTAFLPVFGLLAFAAPLFPEPGLADDIHYYSLINADATHAQFADDNAKRNPDGSVRISLLTVPAKGPAAYTLTDVTINCASLKSQTIATTSFTSDGKSQVAPGEAEATTVKPGTLGEVLKHYICDGIDPYPRSKTIKSLETALDKAPGLIAAAAEK